VRIAEKDVHLRVDGEPNVLGHFLALVPGQAAPKISGKANELSRKRLAYFLCRTPLGQVDENHVATGPLHQGSNGGEAALANDQVAFPVARDGTILGLGWAVADHDHVPDPARPRKLGPLVRAPLRAPRAQAGSQFLSKRPTRLDKERAIDRLV
jgi:hypothetical protein